ncbi:MAG: ABC transporter ATP-binding protein [Deltaproteobacteria bacterium]|nr:MAG: ABC transporter ATP-binding protein [Deltaproteobacteria bacterium]
MGNKAVLEVDKVSRRFGGVVAVWEVSFHLQEGELLGIIGPNGSGKTTLVNLLTGFVKPDSGRVTYLGKNITGKMPYKIAELGIARTFQMAKPFYKLPAFKNLIIPLYSPRVKKLRGGRYGKRDDVAIDLLEEVGFERDSFVPYKMASNLPHGYVKRLELARCLSLRPDLIILDELFSGMSMSEVASTLPIIERLNGEGLSIIMIEHRLRELFRLANRVMVLNFGRKIADGPPGEVMESDAVKAAYLGTEHGE